MTPYCLNKPLADDRYQLVCWSNFKCTFLVYSTGSGWREARRRRYWLFESSSEGNVTLQVL